MKRAILSIGIVGALLLTGCSPGPIMEKESERESDTNYTDLYESRLKQ
jgi:hypothetical protein